MLISFVFRTSDIVYRIAPRRAALKFYCIMTYALRLATWGMANRFYGYDMIKYRDNSEVFVLANIKKEDNVIDVGCGNGRMTKAIAGKARKVLGVEKSRLHMDDAVKECAGLSNVDFMNADIKDAAFAETFDVAILLHIVEHIRDSETALLKLAETAHKIVIETPDREGDWLTNISNDLGLGFLGDEDHFKLYDRRSLSEELEKTGWVSISIERGSGTVRAVAYSKSAGKRSTI